MEDPMPGGLVGRVSACIIGEQFKAFRDGDRLFYSHEGVLSKRTYHRCSRTRYGARLPLS